MNPFAFKQTSNHPGNHCSGCDCTSCDCHGPELPTEMRCCPVCGNVYDITDVLAALVSMVGDLLERRQVTAETGRPFDEADLIDAIETYGCAVAYGEQLLVWVPLHSLDEFLHPLLDETLACHDLHIVLDSSTAMLDLTEVCEVYGLDMGLVYDDCDL